MSVIEQQTKAYPVRFALKALECVYDEWVGFCGQYTHIQRLVICRYDKDMRVMQPENVFGDFQ